MGGGRRENTIEEIKVDRGRGVVWRIKQIVNNGGVRWTGKQRLEERKVRKGHERGLEK